MTGIKLTAEEVAAASAETDDSVTSAMADVVSKIATLINSVYPYLLILVAAVILVWGIYIGVRIAIAHKNEDQINARGMVRNLIIGVVVMFIIMIAVPLVMKALCAWAGVDVDFGYLIGFGS